MTATTTCQKLRDWQAKRPYCNFQLSVVVAIAGGQFRHIGSGRKPQICRWSCHPVCHSSRDISIPALMATLPLPIVGRRRNRPGSVSSH